MPEPVRNHGRSSTEIVEVYIGDSEENDEAVDPIVLDLIEMQRAGLKVTLPSSLGIVYSYQEDDEVNDRHSDDATADGATDNDRR